MHYKSNRTLKQKPDKIALKNNYTPTYVPMEIDSRKYCQVDIKDLANGLENDKQPDIKMVREDIIKKRNMRHLIHKNTVNITSNEGNGGQKDLRAIVLF